MANKITPLVYVAEEEIRKLLFEYRRSTRRNPSEICMNAATRVLMTRIHRERHEIFERENPRLTEFGLLPPSEPMSTGLVTHLFGIPIKTDERFNECEIEFA